VARITVRPAAPDMTWPTLLKHLTNRLDELLPWNFKERAVKLAA
jgi:hypothetical protein